MSWLTGLVVYILVWWVTLFAVLPLWVTPADPDDIGHPAGAPQHPHMLRKLALTTAIAAVIWLAIFLVVASPWLSFRDTGGWPSGDSPSGAPPSGNQPSGDQPSGDQPSGGWPRGAPSSNIAR